MSEGAQIEIPSFDDDDDYTATPIPFGRPQNFQFGAQPAFGSPSGGTSSPVPQSFENHSPTERSYFHARGDSFASESSFGHTRPGTSVSGRFGGHAATPSVATSIYSAPSRKSSFASIRNAFKATRTTASDAPPVPVIDHQSYPALRNPFSRTGPARSIIAQAVPSNASRRRPSAPSPSPSYVPSSSSKSPPIATPQTGIHSRAVSNIAPSTTNISRQIYPRGPDHSPSSSVAHSDPDHHGGRFNSATPPPVPRMPNGIPGNHRPAPSYTSEFSPEIEPSTPAEFALHVVLTQFVTGAEQRIEELLQETLEYDATLADFIGPGVDKAFDELLESLARIAQKQVKLVIDAVSRWKKGQHEQGLPDVIVQRHLTGHAGRGTRIDIQDRLIKRRDITSTYIFCRALIAVVSVIGKESLDDIFGNSLEAIMFSEFVRSPDLHLLTSSNQRANADLFAMVLGHLARIRFQSVTDRFLHELAPLANGQITRDGDAKFENLILGLRHVEINVWPTERFEQGAEFMESLAHCFKNAHGFKLKSIFADTLVYMLHPIGKTAQAEVNIPQWAKAIEIIYSKAVAMMSKPRYWSIAYPLAVTSLCVAEENFFKRHFSSLCDNTLAKLSKERTFRVMLLNGLVRLVWTYLYRCTEPASTVSAKLDNIIRHIFPPGRRSVADDASASLTYVVHFILSRSNLQYGVDLVMDLVQESVLGNGTSTSPYITDVSSPERTTIAIHATLLSLSCLEREADPSWPPSSDFHAPISPRDYPVSATSFPTSVLLRQDIQTLTERFGSIVARLSRICIKSVGTMSVLDPRYRYDHNLPFEEREQVVIRNHPDGTVYCLPKIFVPQLDVLRSCFETWPRCLHPSLPISDALDYLVRSVAHAEPTVADAATHSLHRFSSEPRFVRLVVKALGRSLFASSSLLKDPGWQIVTGHARRVQLWVSVVGDWVNLEKSKQIGEVDEQLILDPLLPPIQPLSLLDQVEAGGLFLLASTSKQIRAFGIKVLHLVPELRERYPHHDKLSDVAKSQEGHKEVAVIDVLSGNAVMVSLPSDSSLLLSDAETARMNKWREAKLPDFLLRLLDSENTLDHSLWVSVLPSVMQACIEYCPTVLDICRDSLNSAVLRYHPMITALAGISSKPTPPSASRFPITPSRTAPTSAPQPEITIDHQNDIDQWRAWIMALCSCAIPMDARPATSREHVRVPSDPSSQRERLSTARGLFRHLIPFLACDYPLFRDAVVGALGSIHLGVFKTLLEDIQSISAHIYDDRGNQPFGKTGQQRARTQDRLHIAVVRVYSLTTRFIKEPRVSQDQGTVSLMLRFVRATEGFLSQPDVRLDWEASRLRRYFCNIIEQLFSTLDREFDLPKGHDFTRITLYRLCEEWCPYGTPQSYRRAHDAMRTNAAGAFRDFDDRKDVIERFQMEAAALAPAAAAAMASLVSGAFFIPQLSFANDAKPSVELLTVPQISEWVGALLSSESKSSILSGRKALRSLLLATDYDNALLESVIRHSYVTSHNPSSEHYFDVVADVIVSTPQHHFDIHQVTWLALVHLGRSDLEIRRKAFRLLDVSHSGLSGSTDFARLDSATRSTAPNIYTQAQRQISGILAAANPDTAYGVLAQCTLRLPQARDGQERLALQCLLPWIPNIVIMSSDKELTREGLGALHNLFSVTVRYGELHADALQSLWATLVTGDSISNGNAVIKFLIEQATIRCNPAFVLHAKKIVAYMSSTSLGPQIFDELCSVLEPPGMILAQAPESIPPPGEDKYFVEDLDALLPVPKSRQQLSPAELAILFLGDFMPDRPWDHDHHLPTLLHVAFSLLDHRINSVRVQIRRTLFQLLRCWSAGYDRLPDRANHPTHSQLMKTIDALEMDPDAFGGQNMRSTEDLVPKVRQLCGAVIEILRAVYPPIEQYWAEIALFWGNRGPVRELACRSFQIFRILSPTLQGSMAVDMMERLSNTISDTSGTDHRFTREILLTLIDYSKSPSVPATLLPQLFWCASACLSSTVEAEFSLAIDMMNAVLDSFDLKLASSVDSLRAHKPRGWGNNELCTERLVFHGLRSSITFEASYHLITRLVEIKGHDVVESSDSRLRLLYVSCLPWCLHIIEDGVTDDRLTCMAEAVATLADEEGRTDISRIMTSLSRNRFKRKEDFVKQAVSTLRENYWSDHATEIVTILLGCILNQETWLRTKSLQILKILLQSIDARNPFTLPGSELLMPLLRLLSSEFATQAMEVLDTPMSISGGPSASHVVRMSVHGLIANDYPSDTIVFGSPAESGWCIAHPSDQSSSCRRNVSAVVSTFNVGPGHAPGTMSMILFTQDDETQPSRTEPDIVIHESEHSSDAASLGELVNTLHDLNTFFQSNGPPAPSSKTIGRFDAEEAERRVAAILSRSLARAPLTQEPRTDDAVPGGDRRDWDIPPTPFVDLFAESSSYDASADALHQNFMRMAEDSDGEDEEDSTDVQQYEASLRQSTPRSNGHTRYRNDSDSEDELNSFSLEDARGPQGWSNPRGGGVRGLLISKRSPKTERGRKI